MTTYNVIRFFADSRDSEVVRSGVSLEEARAHCQREDTRGDDWFDGYQRAGQ